MARKTLVTRLMHANKLLGDAYRSQGWEQAPEQVVTTYRDIRELFECAVMWDASDDELNKRFAVSETGRRNPVSLMAFVGAITK